MESKENDFETTDRLDGSAYDKPGAEDLADTAGDDATNEKKYDLEPPVKVGKYRILSLIVFLLTAGGLFLGLLGNYVSWLAPSYYGSGTSGLDNSLLGFFIVHLKELGSITSILSGPTEIILENAVAILAALLILVSLITTLVSFILTFALPKRAKTATAIGGAVALFAYTMLFLWACYFQSDQMSSFGAKAVDLPVTIIMLALFIVVAVDAILTGGVQGLLSAGIYVFIVAACFAFFFPASFTESHLTLLKDGFSANLFFNLALLVTLGFLVLNLLLSVIALAGKLRGVPQIIFSALQLVAVVVLAVAACLLDKSQKFSFFVGSALLPSIVLVISSLGSLLLAIIILILKKSTVKEVEEVDPYASYSYEAAPALPEEESVEEVAPVEEQAELPVEDVELCTAAEVSDTVEEPAELVEPEMPAVSEEPEPEPEREMTAWEREMLSLAENGAEAPAESAEPQFPYPPYPYDRQTSAPAPRPFTYYTDPSTQYVYDPFINELTPEEKNEFGDLFIACKSGKYGDLPEYRIGGDNQEFFEKVWIRYGLYEMSPSLRDKLFNYLRKYRKK